MKDELKNGLVKMVLRRKLIFLISILFSLMIATVMVIIKKPVYKISFTINASLLGEENIHKSNKLVIINLIKNFNILVDEKNIQTIINANNREIFKNFKSIDINNTTIGNGDPYMYIDLALFIYDTTNLKGIVNIFLQYINETPFFKGQFEREKKNILDIKEKLICSIDEMGKKSKLINDLERSDNLNYNIQYDIYHLQEKLLKLNSRLSQLDGVKLATDAITPNQPIGLSIIQTYILFIFVGAVLGIIIIFCIEKNIFNLIYVANGN